MFNKNIRMHAINHKHSAGFFPDVRNKSVTTTTIQKRLTLDIQNTQFAAAEAENGIKLYSHWF